MIVFGIITPKSRYDAVTLASEIEKRAGGEWSWVLYELNRSYHAVIFGSLEMRGRVSRMKGVEVTTSGEVIESSEDNRSEWLVPRSRGGNSAHQIAAKKVAGFVDAAYRGVAVKHEEPETTARVVNVSAEREVVIPKRRAYKGAISAQDAKHIQKSPEPKSSPAEAPKAANEASAAGTADIARKSRRQKSQTP